MKFAKREGYNQRETSITARRTFLYAGLNGVLGETLYMKQPEEFVEDPDKVYLLEKTLYGWYEATMNGTLDLDGPFYRILNQLPDF